MRQNRAKYGNKRLEIDGVTWDSKREYQRWLVLCQAEKDGLISGLERQPKFELVPKMTETYIKHLKTKDKECERTVQLPITYTADFAYTKNGERVIEDIKVSKAILPKEFQLKLKLMRYVHGIAVRCVYKANESI